MTRRSTALEDDLPDPDQPERPSRSARKRAAEALQALGVKLIALRDIELDALALPEELLAAIHEARRLSNRTALARQRQYIGKLMRDVDPEPIEKALAHRAGNLPRGRMPR